MCEEDDVLSNSGIIVVRPRFFSPLVYTTYLSSQTTTSKQFEVLSMFTATPQQRVSSIGGWVGAAVCFLTGTAGYLGR